MKDDLADIDADVVAKVLENADAFIDADVSIDAIIEWGEREIIALDAQVLEGKLKLPEFRQRAQEVHSEVERKLNHFQEGIARQHASADTV